MFMAVIVGAAYYKFVSVDNSLGLQINNKYKQELIMKQYYCFSKNQCPFKLLPGKTHPRIKMREKRIIYLKKNLIIDELH